MRFRDLPGAKWWKFDFHAHTPASEDFMRGCTQQVKDRVTPEFWLRKFMQEEIDCVAITDHNSGEWIDALKQTLNKMRERRPEGYRPLVLFPGVEISANSGVHVLAIFERIGVKAILINCLAQLSMMAQEARAMELPLDQ